jgi:hypothetical protein
MSDLKSFFNYIYELVVSNVALIICILLIVLLLRIIFDNFLLILIIACLLYIGYKNNKLNQPIPYIYTPTAEHFDGSQLRLYYNPVNSYDVAAPTHCPSWWMYDAPGRGEDEPTSNWYTGQAVHVRMHHTGAPVYISNSPPTDVPSCQQVVCPPSIEGSWTLKDVYQYYPHLANRNNLKCWKCIDTF